MTTSDAALREHPHRRLDLLTGAWVLVSPHRAERPWQGARERPSPAPAVAHDPDCYLCPGNARATGDRNPEYAGTYVFDNDFAALRPGTPHLEVDEGGLLVAHTEPGICRVICFSPRHDLSLAAMSLPAIRGVVDVWAEQYAELGARPEVNHVQLFENTGAIMGCSNPHPHGQVWAQRAIPRQVQLESERQHAHFASHGRTLLSDYLAAEERLGTRIVHANAHFVVVVPFWASWPFETMIVARRPVADVVALTAAERDALAESLSRLTRGYDALFDVPFPYSAGVHQAPTDGAAHPEWHLHLHFYPPLLRSASVRKYMVGYEMLGEPQRDITPERAAERLRAALASHASPAR